MSITITNIFASELLGSPRGAEAPLTFSSPFPSQGKGDKGGWGRIKTRLKAWVFFMPDSMLKYHLA